MKNTYAKHLRYDDESIKLQLEKLMHKPNSPLGISDVSAHNFIHDFCQAACARRGSTQFQISDSYRATLIRIGKILTQSTKGIILMGQVGNGKTTIARGIAALFRYAGNHGLAEGGCRIHDANYLVNMAKHDYKQFEEIADCQRLIVDDLGTEPTVSNNYGTVEAPLAALLRHRYENNLFTMVTTNLDPDAMGSKYDRRTLDRFNEMFERVIINLPSYRSQQ